MVFNAGRYGAFEEWFGQAALFTRTVPTASAVGIGSGSLAIHALGARAAGLPSRTPARCRLPLFGPLRSDSALLRAWHDRARPAATSG